MLRIGRKLRVGGCATNRRVAHGLMSPVTRSERLDLDDVVELSGQRVEMRDRRCAWDVSLVRVLFVIEKVEVGSAVRPLPALLERACRDGEDGDAGRESDPLLHAGQADVDSP